MMQPLANLRTRRRLILGVEGPPFTGKTHLLFSMPRPLHLFNIDNGLEGMAEKFNPDRITVGDYAADHVSFNRKEAANASKVLIQKFVGDFKQTLKITTRQSLGLDTGSEFWRVFRFADLGALKQVPPLRYDKVNMMFSALLNDVYHTPHNLAIIHRTKDKYKEEMGRDGKTISVKVPGEQEMQGFKDMEYIVQVFVRAYRLPKREGKKQTFGFEVRKCRQRASLEGRKYEGALATFSCLAQDVFPKSSASDWE